jgi:hypothetical protein
VFVNYVLLELVAYGFFRLNFGGYDRQSMQITRINAIAQIRQGPVFSGEDENTLPQDIRSKERYCTHTSDTSLTVRYELMGVSAIVCQSVIPALKPQPTNRLPNVLMIS